MDARMEFFNRISTELPFPNRENSASTELLKEHYRPQTVIPKAVSYVSNTAELVIRSQALIRHHVLTCPTSSSVD
jgi:hypothetical protein